MLHLRYDWRRRLAWASLCLIFFLGSHKTNNRKAEDQANDIAKVEKKQPGDIMVINRKWVK